MVRFLPDITHARTRTTLSAAKIVQFAVANEHSNCKNYLAKIGKRVRNRTNWKYLGHAGVMWAFTNGSIDLLALGN